MEWVNFAWIVTLSSGEEIEVYTDEDSDEAALQEAIEQGHYQPASAERVK